MVHQEETDFYIAPSNCLHPTADGKVKPVTSGSCEQNVLLPCSFDCCGPVKTGSVRPKGVLRERVRKQTDEYKHDENRKHGRGGDAESYNAEL